MNAALKSCPAASIQFEVAARCFSSIAIAAMEYAEGLDQDGDGKGKQNQEDAHELLLTIMEKLEEEIPVVSNMFKGKIIRR